MTIKHDERVKEIVEELDVICEQSDHYHLENGYQVAVPAKEILRSKLQTLTKEVRKQTLAEVREGVKKLTMADRLDNNGMETVLWRQVLKLLETLENK